MSRSDRDQLGVLMVTGAYFPELSGGGLQARAVVHALRERVRFTVLTTSIEPDLPRHAEELGVPIHRVFVRVGELGSELMAALQTILFFARHGRRFQIVNVHGFSRKSILIHRLARVFGKRFVLTLQTGAHDEPAGARALGPRAFHAYADADLVISVSPSLARAYVAGGLPEAKLRRVSNAVDVRRFHPALPAEKTAIRRELGLPAERPIVLFVGYFSADKRPDVLYDEWSRVQAGASVLVFVGATDSRYQEVDPEIAARIRRHAAAAARLDDLVFVPPTPAVDKYFRAADVYVLPSRREGLPIALLEAMSCGLACVATRLEGSTDTIIEHGMSGVLVDTDDDGGFARALTDLLTNPSLAKRMGDTARTRVIERYSIDRTAEQWLSAYREVLNEPAV
jgi:glycosyltransferase involved in cell wall biosynthesis